MRLHRVSGTVALLVLCVAVTGLAGAVEIWTVRSGVTTMHLNVDLLRDLGLEVVGVADTTDTPEEMELRMDTPRYSFALTEDTNLRFQVEHGNALAHGIMDGALRHTGQVLFRERETGAELRWEDFTFDWVPEGIQNGNEVPRQRLLMLRNPGDATDLVRLEHSMFDFDRKESRLWIHYLNMSITPEWAEAMGRPDLEGWTIGMAEVIATAQLISSTPPTTEAYQPNFTGFLDVKLGAVFNIQQVNRLGTYPNGTAALSMATMSCNAGDADVPWHAPMEEGHPTIHMAIYRLLNGVLEQIGISWMKHGFYALSDSDCTPCQHQSDGTFLGVGCSDIYGVMNNSDRNYLGARSEVDPFKAQWTCTGSHFAGGQPDCQRRHGGGGHGPLDHRLTARDADLNNPGATYYYEGCYYVPDDLDTSNNIGSRICTMSWNGNAWDFITPSQDNPLVVGPAINRWGEMQTAASVGPQDGEVILSVQTTDLGDGRWHYEYGLFNFRSELRVRSFSIPVAGVNEITNIGYYDPDENGANDWQVTLEAGALTWQTDTYQQDPNANALMFGSMYNFRFDADAPPADVDATLGLFKPSDPNTMPAATRGPTQTVSVADAGSAPVIRLDPARPNPLTSRTSIGFALAAAGPARLDVYDLQGRRVQTLHDAWAEAGDHSVVWDAQDGQGRPVGSGVYLIRLQSDKAVVVRSVVLVH